MNYYSHLATHNNRVREQQTHAEHHRLDSQNKGNHRSAYKELIAHVGGTFIFVGTTLQHLVKS